ncbi:hypothetical protein DICPUDRAFT_150570 [Dictyostelium purpureum]|uniref:Peptidase A22B family protein n=1 Tax=Dictyostelium purpureum TaxID=5786 RepID=F0ZGN7_DICPU|nr:uncharacterized protein DICPUDRAFT_150570 [Dictyostelium purpureum]EGC36877.1 hypothetical protein DICPUDRAFT_150570 [Dictyostelium purpureum]|eukprot:XP_003286599.1 hypothetical protein DICPUDRAFT_150570 [Dictyostelium purpureum]
MDLAGAVESFKNLKMDLTLPDTGLLIAYFAIWTMAIIPIYIGSYLSLKETKNESMSKSDAYTFPIVGSIFLFGLYLCFKYFDKDLVNTILQYYFLIIGTFAMTGVLSTLFRYLAGSNNNTKEPKKSLISFKIPHIKYVLDAKDVNIDIPDIIAFLISAAFSVWYIKTKNWIANNIFGLTFSIQGISLISLSEYSVGVILLVGLFFYDIFWVFGTDVMVTVAKSFDAPIKLLFPKNIFAETFQFSMLGLGDIVLPGIFIALLLRFDRHLHQEKKTKGKGPMKTTYFSSTLVAYALGLFTTIFVMHVFKAAQPALLYLVPFCVGSSLLVSAVKGQFKKLIFSNLNEEATASTSKKTN